MAVKTPDWPTQTQWEKSFTQGLKAASAGVTTSPAISDMVDVLGDIIEAKTGKPLGQLVTEQVASLVAKTARQFVDGALDIGAELGKTIGQLAGAVAGIIPIFAIAVDASVAALEASNAKQNARLKSMTQKMLDRCRGSYVRVLGTGSGGSVTPADLFRSVYEARAQDKLVRGLGSHGRHEEWRYPVSGSALLCALCGPQSPLGWNTDRRSVYVPPKGDTSAAGATSREVICHEWAEEGYETFIADLRKRRGKPELGLSLDVRTRMAQIIEGILASVRPWTLEEIAPVGDQGRTLFPVLMDIMLHEHRAGHWDVEMLQALQRSQIKCYSVTDYNTGQRIAPVIDLSTDVVGLVMGWKSTIESASADYPARRRYLTAGKRKALLTKKRPRLRPKLTLGALRRKSPKVALKRRRLDRAASVLIALGVTGLAATALAKSRG